MDITESKTPSSEQVSPSTELENLVKNELNRYTDLIITAVKELKKEYKNLEFEDKIDKMFAVFYMDKIPDYKVFVGDTYNKHFRDYNNAHIALLSTLQDVETHMETMNDLIDLGAPESEYSSTSSLSDKRSNHRKR